MSSETTHRTARQHTKHRRRGGRRRNRRAGLRRPWAVAENGRTTSRRAKPPQPGPTGVEGARGICRGAGGRWRGLAGLRGDAPSEARGADGSRAGRRPPAHTAAGPTGAQNTRGATSSSARQHNNDTRPRPVSRPRPRHAHAAPFTTAPPAIRRSCPRDPQPRRGQPRGGRRGRGTGSRTRSPGPHCGRSGSTAGRHRARHTRRA